MLIFSEENVIRLLQWIRYESKGKSLISNVDTNSTKVLEQFCQDVGLIRGETNLERLIVRDKEKNMGKNPMKVV